MSPVDDQMLVPSSGGPPSQICGSIPLGSLIEYAIQRTHHELTVLSELLPRKTDMERKLDLFQFASRTRHLFVRILALVKWASSIGKVDKCADICLFLERQSMLFVETADFLHRMSHETLVTARLASFSLPCAIDVLTTGTYPRLPTCIRDRIIPPDPITVLEKRETLQRLNQVIQYRLVSTELPTQMRRLKIEQGRVRFYVENEFEVTLTLMGDSADIPWRLLDIAFQVEDHETGTGKSLVHPLQVHYIHQLAQSRLLGADKPLHDLYKLLHYFCLSLQLEVLHSQSQRLIQERLSDFISLEQYVPSKALVLLYWRDLSKRQKANISAYRLNIQVCSEDECKPLQVSHSPEMSIEDSRCVGVAIKCDHLSLEKLIMKTIDVRTHCKLNNLAKDFQRLATDKCEVKDLPAALHVPVLFPCMSSEVLHIAVNVQTGAFLASVPGSKRDEPAVLDIQDCLNNGDIRRLEQLVSALRVHLSLRRIERSVQLMPATAVKTLSIVNMAEHLLKKLPQSKLFIRVPRQPNIYLVVTVDDEGGQVIHRYYLLATTSCTHCDHDDDATDSEAAKLFLRAGHMFPINVFSHTHGQHCKLFDSSPVNVDSLSRKRKIFLSEGDDPEGNKIKESSCFVAELPYILAQVEEKVPFVQLGIELQQRGFFHSGLSVDFSGTCLSLTIIDFPDDQEDSDGRELIKRLLSCTFRIQSRASRNWVAEFVFCRGPLPSDYFKESGNTVRLCLTFDLSGDSAQRTVCLLLDEWRAMCRLYRLVAQFADSYNDVKTGVQGKAMVKSYNYRKLCLVYGPEGSHSVTVQWKSELHRFQLTFGTCLPSSTVNPHLFTMTHLQEQLNSSLSLVQLVQVLNDTLSPLTAISKLSSLPAMGTSFSASHVRLVFRNCLCVDIHMLPEGVASLRDGSYSLFDSSRVMEGLSPTPNLKTFVSKFAADTEQRGIPSRHLSMTVDDIPPSPICPDIDMFAAAQQQLLGSPASITSGGGTRQRGDGFRFHSKPMTPPSNPHTPASPRISIIASPSAALIGTPSPATLLMTNSPGSAQLPALSPQTILPTPSPQSLAFHIHSPALPFTAPVVSPPSRVLPQRVWTAAVPTLLSHDGLMRLLAENSLSGYNLESPLERFLSLVLLRRHMQRIVQGDAMLSVSQSTEQGTICFKTESLVCRIFLNPTTLHSLHLRVQPISEYADKWDAEELQILEKFFEHKVVCPPYKVNPLTAFGRLIGAPFKILKDCVHIMRLELLQFMRQGVGGEEQSVCVPMLFEIAENRVKQVNQHGSPALAAVANILNHFSDMHQTSNECSIFPAVKELMTNLIIPS